MSEPRPRARDAMTLVGEFYEAVNRGDAAEVASFYDDACQVELT